MRTESFRKTITHAHRRNTDSLRERETIYANDPQRDKGGPEADPKSKKTAGEVRIWRSLKGWVVGVRVRMYLQNAQPIRAKLGRVTWCASRRRQSSSPTDQIADRPVPVSRQRRWRMQSTMVGCWARVARKFESAHSNNPSFFLITQLVEMQCWCCRVVDSIENVDRSINWWLKSCKNYCIYNYSKLFFLFQQRNSLIINDPTNFIFGLFLWNTTVNDKWQGRSCWCLTTNC